MIYSAFYNDFDNIDMWVSEAALDIEKEGDTDENPYYNALASFIKLKTNLIGFFGEKKTDIEALAKAEDEDEKKKVKDLENDYYDFIKAAEQGVKYMNEKGQPVPVEFKRLMINAHRDRWAFSDARKKPNELLTKSEALNQANEAFYAPRDVKALEEMEKRLKELEKRAKDVEKNTLDAVEKEFVKSIATEKKKDMPNSFAVDIDKEELTADNADTSSEGEKEGEKEAEKAKVAAENAEVAAENAEVAAEKTETAAEKTETEAEKTEAEKGEEGLKAEYENLQQTEVKLEESFTDEVDTLVAKMKKEDDNLHINSKEFKNMRDSLYDLVNYTKQIKEEMAKDGKTTLDFEKQLELHKKIEQLQQNTRIYMEAKGMGRQLTGLGKRRMELAASIDSYIFELGKNARENIAKLERTEEARLRIEAAEEEKERVKKAIQEEIEGYAKTSRYPTTTYVFNKAKDLENLQGDSFVLKQFKERFAEYREALETEKDPVRMSIIHNRLTWAAKCLNVSAEVKKCSKEQQKLLNSLAWLGDGEITKLIKEDNKSNKEVDLEGRRDFFEKEIKSFAPMMSRLAKAKNLPIEAEELLEEYNNYISEKDPEKTTPAYKRFRFLRMAGLADGSGHTLRYRQGFSLPAEENAPKYQASIVGHYLVDAVRDTLRLAESNYTDKSLSEDIEEIGKGRILDEFFDRYGDFLGKLSEKNADLKKSIEAIDRLRKADNPDYARIRALMNYKLYKSLENAELSGMESTGLNENQIPGKISRIKSDCVFHASMVANKRESFELLADIEMYKLDFDNKLEELKKSSNGNPGRMEKMFFKYANMYKEFLEQRVHFDNDNSRENFKNFQELFGDHLYGVVVSEREGKLSLPRERIIMRSAQNYANKLSMDRCAGDKLKGEFSEASVDFEKDADWAEKEDKRLENEAEEERLNKNYIHKDFKAKVKKVYVLLKQNKVDGLASEEYKNLIKLLDERVLSIDVIIKAARSFDNALVAAAKEEGSIKDRYEVTEFNKAFLDIVKDVAVTDKYQKDCEHRIYVLRKMGFDVSVIENGKAGDKEENTPEKEYVRQLKKHLEFTDKLSYLDKLVSGREPDDFDKKEACKLFAFAKLSKSILNNYDNLFTAGQADYMSEEYRKKHTQAFTDLDKFIEKNYSREGGKFEIDTNMYEKWSEEVEKQHRAAEKKYYDGRVVTLSMKDRFRMVGYLSQKADIMLHNEYYDEKNNDLAAVRKFYDKVNAVKFPKNSFLDFETRYNIADAHINRENNLKKDCNSAKIDVKNLNIEKSDMLQMHTVATLYAMKEFNDNTSENDSGRYRDENIEKQICGDRRWMPEKYNEHFEKNLKILFRLQGDENQRKQMYTYALDKAKEILLKAESITSPKAILLGRLLKDNKAGYTLDDNLKDMLTLMQYAEEAIPEKIEVLEKIKGPYENTVSECRNDYKKLGVNQLVIRHVNTLNKMTPEERQKFVEKGGVKDMVKSLKDIQQYLEDNKPKFLDPTGLKDVTVENHQKIAIIKTVTVTFTKDHADEFLEKQKQAEMNSADKKDDEKKAEEEVQEFVK